MKRLIGLLIFLLGLSGCATASSATEGEVVASEMPEGVLMDNEYAHIELGDIEIVADYYAQVKLTIESKSDKVYVASPTNITVNGFALSPFGEATLLPGKIHDIKSFVGTGILKWMGYSQLNAITMAYEIYDPSDYDHPLASTATYTYSLNEENSEAKLPDDAYELISKDQLKFYIIGMDAGETILSSTQIPTVYYYVENNGEDSVEFTINQIQGNDGEIIVDGLDISDSVPGNSKKLGAVSFGDSTPYEVYEKGSFVVTMSMDEEYLYEFNIKN